MSRSSEAFDIDFGTKPATRPPPRFTSSRVQENSATPIRERPIGPAPGAARTTTITRPSPLASRKEFAEGQTVKVKNPTGVPGYSDGEIYLKNADGSYDIEYTTGKLEKGVAVGRIAVPPPSSDTTTITSQPPTSASTSFRIGSKVESKTRGSDRWYAGTVLSQNRDGTYDIRLETGEENRSVSTQNIRSVSSGITSKPTTSSSYGLDIDEGEYANVHSNGRWLPGVISKVRLDGDFDVRFDNGEVETGVSARLIRLVSKHSVSRLHYTSTFSSDKHNLVEGKYSPGAKLACYWYRPSKFGAARVCKAPKSVIVLKLNPDNTYTVELEEDGAVYDDVEERHLKHWTEANNDLPDGDQGHGKGGAKKTSVAAVDAKWSAVCKMAQQNLRNNKRSSSIAADPAKILTDSSLSELQKLEAILGERSVDDLRHSFERYDKYDDRELSLTSALDAFEDLGGRASEKELRAWMKSSKASSDRASELYLNLTQFIFAYANLFHPSDATIEDIMGQSGLDSLGRTLRLHNAEMRGMSEFAKTFGEKLLQKLERAFDDLSAKDSNGNDTIRASQLVQAFGALDKAVTMTRLTDWMHEADVSANDRLGLADFAVLYALFFAPVKEKAKSGVSINATDGLRSLPEMAIQVLREERWRGTHEQTVMFVTRMCAGRSDAVCQLITKVRSAFEQIDVNGDGEIPLDLMKDLFALSELPLERLREPLKKFEKRLQEQRRTAVSLPDVFEHFGLFVQEVAETSISVSDAVSLFTLKHSNADVRLACEVVMSIVNNILSHEEDPSRWSLNIANVDFHGKVWQYPEGKDLMRSVGFGDPTTERSAGPTGKSRVVITLRDLPTDLASDSKKPTRLPKHVLAKLKSRQHDLEQEITALEGAPSVSSAVFEIRRHHSLDELRTGLETAQLLLRNLMASPENHKLYRVKSANPQFIRALGRLKGCVMLMNAIGFVAVTNPDSAPSGGGGGGDDQFCSFYELRQIGATSALGASTKDFKFPTLNEETKLFLARRIADITTCLKRLENDEDSQRLNKSVVVSDAAHITGVSQLAASRKVDLKASLSGKAALGKASALNGTAAKGSPVRSASAGPAGKRPLAASGKQAIAAAPPSAASLAATQLLKPFLYNASPAQQAQIAMIRDVFSRMDSDADGVLSLGDVRAYFRTIGRNFSELEARNWISSRDVDQDGVVSLTEFVASYALQMDSGSSSAQSGAVDSSSVAMAFGSLRLGSTVAEAVTACNAVEEYVRRILDAPTVSAYWSIQVNEANFKSRIGRLFGGVKLMTTFGFESEANGAVLALRDPNGKGGWQTVPQSVRVELNRKLEELRSHRNSLNEPTISNLAAVSSAINALGADSATATAEWITALETIIKYVSNIISKPSETQYYSIPIMGEAFNKKVGRLPGALGILFSLGFRETEGGYLVLDLATDPKFLEARRLELQCGVEKLKEKALTAENQQKATEAAEVTEKGKKAAAAGSAKSGIPVKSTAAGKGSAPVVASGSSTPGRPATEKETRKLDATLHEEKQRRLKAEAALLQKNAALSELQSQLYDMKESEQRTLSLQYGLTVERMPEEAKAKVKQQIAAAGRTLPGEKTSSVALPVTDKSKSSGGKSKDDHVKTVTTAPCNAGECRVSVESQDGFKKGMKVLIGSGSTVECRTIVGFGSLLLDSPLSFNHPAGVIVIAYAPTAKNIEKIEHRLNVEFVRGLLVEELVPLAVQIGRRNIQNRELTRQYALRPVMKHVYTVEKLDEIHLGVVSTPSDVTVCGGLAGGVVVTKNGSLGSCLIGTVSVVELVGFFEYMLSVAEAEGSRSGEGDVSAVPKEICLKCVNADTLHRSVFQLLCETQAFTSVDQLLDKHASKDGALSWRAFCAMLTDRPTSSASQKIILSSDLPYKSSLTAASIALLMQAFDLTDCDGDECLSVAESQALFVLLDGGVKAVSHFVKSVVKVLGTYSEDTKLSRLIFLAIREDYCSVSHALSGGMCLQGALQMVQLVLKQITDGELRNVSAINHSSVLQAKISKDVVRRQLHGATQHSECFSPSHTTSSESGTLSDRLELTTSSTVSVTDLFLDGTSLFTKCAAVTPWTHAQQDKGLQQNAKQDIVQTCCDYTKSVLYALNRSGVVSVYELSSNSLLFEQRVMWAEPAPSRSVEGGERFAKWRKMSGLDATEGVRGGDADMHLTSLETQRMAALLSKFSLSLPVETQTIAVDSETGLVAVNCSVLSGSIVIFEPVSLRRIYRIRSPAKCSAEVSDALRTLTFGRSMTDMAAIQPRHCVGLLNRMEILVGRGVIVCQVVGSTDVSVVSLLTGDVLVELTGHSDTISSLSVSRGIGAMFTGSDDCSVRVWLLSDAIPPQKSAVSSLADDSPMLRLENKIASAGVSHKTATPSTAGSAKVLKKLYTHLCACLNVPTVWRRARVAGFFDGQQFSSVRPADQQLAYIEIVYENASVALVPNRIALREVGEMLRAPNGPPLWSESPAELAIGNAVALYEVDPDMLTLFLCRRLGVSTSTVWIGEEQLIQLLRSLLCVGGGFDRSDLTLSSGARGLASGRQAGTFPPLSFAR
eukprot:gene24262-30582_t